MRLYLKINGGKSWKEGSVVKSVSYSSRDPSSFSDTLLGSSQLPDKTVTNGAVKNFMVIGAWRNGLLVKFMGCSCWGPKFDPQHPDCD